MRRTPCMVAVRLIGILVVILTFAEAWKAAFVMLFDRLQYGYVDWLWPFWSYDEAAMSDLGTLLQFAFGLVLVFRASWVSRLVMWRVGGTGECASCGYDVRGISGVCPECSTPVRGAEKPFVS